MAAQYRKLKDNIRTYRDGVRDASFMLDVELTETGFTGTENTDWENIEQVNETVQDFDGNLYTTIRIGTQEWMVENLRTTHYADGTDIPNLTANLDWTGDTSGAYCWYNNDAVTYDDYGCLYNWYAVNNAHGLAPIGWRVATDADWTTLTTYLGGLATSGGKLKETGTIHWTTPNTGATNEVGFISLAGGYRNAILGVFADIGNGGYFWTSTIQMLNFAWYRSLYYNTIEVSRFSHSVKAGYSVRCVRDI